MIERFLVTGCSSGGKSSLIGCLEQRGYAVVHEPGLRVIRGDGPKPWQDRLGFFDAVHRISLEDLASTERADSPTFFDRGLFDALSGMASRQRAPIADFIPGEFHYAQPVFYVPPWPEIYEQTEDRPHGFDMALDEALRLRRDLTALKLDVIDLPKVSVEQRADIVLAAVNQR